MHLWSVKAAQTAFSIQALISLAVLRITVHASSLLPRLQPVREAGEPGNAAYRTLGASRAFTLKIRTVRLFDRLAA